ncbi:hypothetical protein [Nocardiopsis gilva]|uniref:hypothetical protein n=1 Tax=Nocardiopsis gilva TaxID=280236 RepID=UPI0003476663|nr:hypothetical protein [Nocardiopsis gilva]
MTAEDQGIDNHRPSRPRARQRQAAPAPEPWEAVLDERMAEPPRGSPPPGDPTPADIRATARAAFATCTDDAIIAEVVNDSLDDPATDLRAVSDLAASPRYIRFHAAGLTVRVEITVRDDHRDIVGRVSPTDATDIHVRWPCGSTWHHLDESGTFAARSLPRGPVSILLHRKDGPPVSTPWMAY